MPRPGRDTAAQSGSAYAPSCINTPAKGRRHRKTSVNFSPIRSSAVLTGPERGARGPACGRPLALEEIGPKLMLRPRSGQIDGRGAKEEGGIPSVMQLPQYAHFWAMFSYTTVLKSRDVSAYQKSGERPPSCVYAAFSSRRGGRQKLQSMNFFRSHAHATGAGLEGKSFWPLSTSGSFDSLNAPASAGAFRHCKQGRNQS